MLAFLVAKSKRKVPLAPIEISENSREQAQFCDGVDKFLRCCSAHRIEKLSRMHFLEACARSAGHQPGIISCAVQKVKRQHRGNHRKHQQARLRSQLPSREPVASVNCGVQQVIRRKPAAIGSGVDKNRVKIKRRMDLDEREDLTPEERELAELLTILIDE